MDGVVRRKKHRHRKQGLDQQQGCTHRTFKDTMAMETQTSWCVSSQVTSRLTSPQNCNESATDLEEEKHETVKKTSEVHIKPLSSYDKRDNVHYWANRKCKNRFIDEFDGLQIVVARRKKRNHVLVTKYDVLKTGLTNDIGIERKTEDEREKAPIQNKAKNNKKRRAPGATSQNVYDELCKGQVCCFFIIACSDCTAEEIPLTQIQTHNECAKTKLMGRTQMDKVFTCIRERPFKYQAVSGLCSYPVNSCPLGEKCDYPHSNAERLLWNCTNKYQTNVRNFQADVNFLNLRHVVDQIAKKRLTVEQVCVTCLKKNDTANFTKRPHKPRCGHGHNLSGGNLTIIVRREDETKTRRRVFCTVDVEFQEPGIDEELKDITERIESLRQNGYTIEEIVRQYKAVKQCGSITRDEHVQSTDDVNQSYQNRRRDFEFMPSQTEYCRKAVIYDTKFGDLMPEEDVDSEEELSANDYSGLLKEEEQLRYSLTSIQECERLLQKQPDTYKRCIIHLNGSMNATCTPLDQSEPNIKIHGRHNCGTAFDGDEVIVEIKLLVDVETKKTRRGGRVRCVTKHCTNRGAYVFVCVVDEFASNVMIPLCGKAPKIRIYDKEVKSHNKNGLDYNDQRITVYKQRHTGSIIPVKGRETSISADIKYNRLFVVKYTKWDARRTYPFGYVTKVIRGGDNLWSGSLVLKLKYQVPMTSAAVPQEMDYDSIILEAKRAENRKNLIDLKVFSIDAEGCLDVGNAISLEYICCGQRLSQYKVGVHISDVTALVSSDSPVDKAAAKRRTSYYPLLDTVHMLPEYLATNFCSLSKNKHRLAMSFFFILDKTGKIVEKPTVCESVICNRKQFTYTEAHSIILGSDKTGNSFSAELKILFSLALQIRSIRKQPPANQYGDINSYDDCDIKFPPSDKVDDSNQAHVLVEEFQILVNAFTAELMCGYRPDRGLLCNRLPQSRNTAESPESYKSPYMVGCQHPPLKDDVDAFTDTFGCSNREHFTSENITFMRSTLDDLRSAAARGDAANIKELLCRPETFPHALMTQKESFTIQTPAHVVLPESTRCGHFSLQGPCYTWFTSPIRRYIDIVNHRMLKAVMRKSDCMPYLTQDLESICNKFNKTHLRQKQFHEALRQLKAYEFLKEMPLFIPCIVHSTDNNAIQCVIPFIPHCKATESKIQYDKLILSRKPKQRDGFAGKVLWFERRIYDINNRCTSTDNNNKGVLVYSRNLTHDTITDTSLKNRYTGLTMINVLKSKPQETSQQMKNRTKCHKGRLASHIVHVVDFGTLEEYSNIEVTSEMMSSVAIVRHQAPFTVTWSPGDLLQLQISSTYKKGILGTSINGISLMENLYHCYQHNNDPVTCFTEVAERQSKRRYNNVRDYQETWVPIINMEAITNTMQDASPIIVRGVTITLNQHKRDVYGSIQFGKRFLKRHAINFIPQDFAGNDEDDFQDYLCLQIPMQQSGECLPKGNNKIRPYINGTNRWVAHALVINVKDEKNKSQNKPEKDDINLKQETDAANKRLLRVDFKLHQFSTKMTKLLLDERGRGTHTGNIEFMSKTLRDRRMFNAVIKLEDATDFSRDIVRGNALDRKATMSKEWLNIIPDCLDIDVKTARDKQKRNLQLCPNNRLQIHAIDEGLRRRFTVIQGPPGTGKTLTGVKLLYWFVQLNRHMEAQDGVRRQVMYCCPSDSAVDVATRFLKYRLAEKCPTIVRVFSENIDSQDFPVPREYARSNKKNKYDGLSREELKEVALHFLIRKECNQGQRAEEIKKFDQRFNTVKPELIQDAEVDEYNDIVKEACIDELAKYDIILCTCSVSSEPRIQRGCSIRQCVIDESNMCMEPETLVPITGLSPQPEQIVLIGDHKQLRPIVKNPTARRLGLNKSLFERYAIMQTDLITLEKQYRMHEKICEFPSNHFYGGKLKTNLAGCWRLAGELPERVWPNKAPFVFCNVEGLEETELIASVNGNEQSICNKADAANAIRIFLAFTNDLNVDHKRIAILSQYKAQVKYIKKQLTEIHNFEHPNVRTVVSGQGEEWDFVILSTVRSLPQYEIDSRPSSEWLKINLGLIIDQNQINVALTRARKGLVIIGNKHLLQCENDRKHGLWGNLLDYYNNNGCLVDADKFPAR